MHPVSGSGFILMGARENRQAVFWKIRQAPGVAGEFRIVSETKKTKIRYGHEGSGVIKGASGGKV